MFETVEQAEIEIPEAFQAQGERCWSYVYRRLHVPWFHLRYLPPPDPEDPTRLWLVLFLDEISHLVRLKEQGADIDEVQIVLPGHLTGKDRTTMALLGEVWVGTEPTASQHETYIYVLADGTRIVNSGLDTAENDLIGRHRLFAAGTRRRRRRR